MGRNVCPFELNKRKELKEERVNLLHSIFFIFYQALHFARICYFPETMHRTFRAWDLHIHEINTIFGVP